MYSKTECVGVWSDGQRVARWSGSQYAVFEVCGKSCYGHSPKSKLLFTRHELVWLFIILLTWSMEPLNWKTLPNNMLKSYSMYWQAFQSIVLWPTRYFHLFFKNNKWLQTNTIQICWRFHIIHQMKGGPIK